MPADIDGTNFVAGRDKPAWHRLGTVVPDLMTVTEALDLSNLAGWDVRKDPLTIELDGATHVMPDQYVTSRNIDGEREPMAVVGNKYKVVQNETIFATADSLLDVGGAQVDTMGALNNGCTVFGAFLLPNTITIDGEGIADEVDTYLLALSSHDGSAQTTYGVTNVRVVCQNTLTVSLKGMTNKYKVRHTKNAKSSIIDARKTLKVAYKHTDKFAAEAKALFETPADSNTFDSIINAVFGDRPDSNFVDGKNKAGNKQTRWDNKRDTLHEIRRAGTGDGIRNTAWGAFNAIEEYFDYYRNTRGDNNNLYTAHLDLSGGTVANKTNTLAAVKEVAGVV